MSLPPQPDMAKVRAALKLYAPKPTPGRPACPPPFRPPAVDAAIRKPLVAHGNPCRGFDCRHFLNNDD